VRALTSNPSTTKNKREREKKGERRGLASVRPSVQTPVSQKKKEKNEPKSSYTIIQYRFNIKNFQHRPKEGHIITKGSIHQSDVTITNTHVPNIRAPKHIKQTLTELEGETDSCTK
jgi:hypothetical protein